MLIPNLGAEASGNGDLPWATQQAVPYTEGFLREVVWLTGTGGQTTETPTCGSRAFQPKLAAPFENRESMSVESRTPGPHRAAFHTARLGPLLGTLRPGSWVICSSGKPAPPYPPPSTGSWVPGGLPAGPWDRLGGGSEPLQPPC